MSDDTAEADALPQSSTPDSAPNKGVATSNSLRIWPAVVLLIAVWGLRLSASLTDEPSLTSMMAQLMGPAAISLLLLGWWTLLSRATIKERLLGFIGIVVIAVATTATQHETVQGFGTVIFSVPWGLTAFALGAICFRSRPGVRLQAALIFGLVGFGYWSLVRTDEIRGDFQTVQRWRWAPTPEEEFLASLDQQAGSSDAGAFETAVSGTPEWPEFRGPDRAGIVTGIVVAEDWKTNPPKEIWRSRIGPGWSSYSVAGQRIFTQEQRGESEAVVCYDAADGRQVWAHEDESRFWETIAGAGPRGTPTIAAGSLFALGANGILNRLNIETGQPMWSRDLQDDAQRKPPTWGFSSSPLVTQGLVVVHAGGEDDKGLFAYDQETGDLRWSAPAGDHSYSSAQLSTVDGKQCILILTNKGLRFIDPTDGAVLGFHEWLFEGYRVVQPLVLADSKILLGTPMGPGTQCIQANWDGTNFEVEELWTSRRMNPYYNDYVVHKGYLFGFDNRIFACVDLADGKRKWKGGRYGHGQVLLLPEKDQLLLISEDGELVLLRATPKEHTELARFQALESRTWNHPVLVGNRIYVRNAEEAACFELTLEATADPSDGSDERADQGADEGSNAKN